MLLLRGYLVLQRAADFHFINFVQPGSTGDLRPGREIIEPQSIGGVTDFVI